MLDKGLESGWKSSAQRTWPMWKNYGPKEAEKLNQLQHREERRWLSLNDEANRECSSLYHLHWSRQEQAFGLCLR